MYLVVIAWLYVVLMMSVAEATNTTRHALGALITFVLYGLVPVALVVYLMGAPARNSAIKKRNARERADELARANPDAGSDTGDAAVEKQQPPAGAVDPDSASAPRLFRPAPDHRSTPGTAHASDPPGSGSGALQALPLERLCTAGSG